MRRHTANSSSSSSCVVRKQRNHPSSLRYASTCGDNKILNGKRIGTSTGLRWWHNNFQARNESTRVVPNFASPVSSGLFFFSSELLSLLLLSLGSHHEGCVPNALEEARVRWFTGARVPTLSRRLLSLAALARFRYLACGAKL